MYPGGIYTRVYASLYTLVCMPPCTTLVGIPAMYTPGMYRHGAHSHYVLSRAHDRYFRFPEEERPLRRGRGPLSLQEITLLSQEIGGF